MTGAVLPPAGTPGETWHWLRHGDDDTPIIGLWRTISSLVSEPQGMWCMIGGGYFQPNQMETIGYRYLEPVTPPSAEGQDGGEP